ncbi:MULTISPECIES: hypothetical protein [Streptomyces]|uniref:hypothetical protein n=1 Tax=Streptomyces TaxID=1883 RepID=UPI000B2CD0AD|nr:hypothetical protein [Streptomyces sp. NRRL S-237]
MKAADAPGNGAGDLLPAAERLLLIEQWARPGYAPSSADTHLAAVVTGLRQRGDD